MRRIILVAVVLTLAVPSAFFFKRQKVVGNATISSSFMEDVSVINKESGKDRWTMNASRIEIPSDGSSTKLSLVKIHLPEQEMDVTSESGIYDLQSRDLTLSGNIIAKTTDYIVRTASIQLKSETGILSSQDRVVLEGESFKIEGDGFQTNGEKKVTFNSNVKATFF